MTDEEALIAASKRGDSTALDALVCANQDRVYAFAMRMCRNVEDAKGILQKPSLGVVRRMHPHCRSPYAGRRASSMI